MTVRQQNNVISINGVASTFNNTDVKSIVINGQDGADTINLNIATPAIHLPAGFSNGKFHKAQYSPASQAVTVPTTIYGGKGDDTIHGGAGIDIIYGGGQNDKLFGYQGDDKLYGE
ncbi:MAG: hypothetical protein EXR99_16925, partial [Gemmataceae bacterium]|nr:hypothetical protein [Gemmataceae bacterium]